MANVLPMYINIENGPSEIFSPTTFSFSCGSSSPIQKMYAMTSEKKIHIPVLDIEAIPNYYLKENCAKGSFLIDPSEHIEKDIIIKIVIEDEQGLSYSKVITTSKNDKIEDSYFGIIDQTSKTELTYDYVLEGYFFNNKEKDYQEEITKTIEVKINNKLIDSIISFDSDTKNIPIEVSTEIRRPHFYCHIPKSDIEGTLSIQMNMKSAVPSETIDSYSYTFNLENKSIQDNIIIESNRDTEITDSLYIKGYCTGEDINKFVHCTISDTDGSFISDEEIPVDIIREDVYPLYSSQKICGFESTIDMSYMVTGNFDILVSAGVAPLSLSLKSISTESSDTSSIKIYKKKEPWLENPQSNDIVSRIGFLNELKENMIKIISDYAGRGIENEEVLTIRAQKMFTGYIVPSRDDWNTLSDILKELSTIKELGNAYDYFISDLSDGLGLSDIHQIRSFIDYIQTIGPKPPFLSLSVESAEMYYPINFIGINNGDSTYIDLSWKQSPIVKPKTTIEYTPSITEDVHDYSVSYTIGNHLGKYEGLVKDKEKWVIDTDWQSWTSPTDSTFKIKVEGIDTDKRGNSSDPSIKEYILPSNSLIPRGVQSSEVEYNLNQTGWTSLTNTTSFSARHNLPYPISGEVTYRVRFIDKTSGLKSVWVQSPSYPIKKYPPVPAKPVPSASTSYTEATVSWPAVKYADYYEVWVGDLNSAKKTGGHYYSSIKNLSHKITNLKENTNYTFSVRATNISGNATGTCTAKTKQLTPKTITYNSTGVKTWNTSYRFKNAYGYIGPWQGNWWRSENEAIQGLWKDYWPLGFNLRGGGTYWAWHDQEWGYNSAFIIFDYNKMRRDLKGKNIQSVTVTLRRTGSEHGWMTGMPIHWASCRTPNANKTGGKPAFTGRLISNVNIDRNGTANVTDKNTKELIRRIVNDGYTGIVLDKDYKGAHPRQDKAYMRFRGNVTVKVTYLG